MWMVGIKNDLSMHCNCVDWMLVFLLLFETGKQMKYDHIHTNHCIHSGKLTLFKGKKNISQFIIIWFEWSKLISYNLIDHIFMTHFFYWIQQMKRKKEVSSYAHSIVVKFILIVFAQFHFNLINFSFQNALMFLL